MPIGDSPNLKGPHSHTRGTFSTQFSCCGSLSKPSARRLAGASGKGPAPAASPPASVKSRLALPWSYPRPGWRRDVLSILPRRRGARGSPAAWRPRAAHSPALPPQPLYEGWFLALYNLLYTTLPVLYIGLFEQVRRPSARPPPSRGCFCLCPLLAWGPGRPHGLGGELSTPLLSITVWLTPRTHPVGPERRAEPGAARALC